MIDNSGLNFSNLDGYKQSKSKEIKSFSFAESLSGNNHDFANSNSSSDSNLTSASAAVINAPTAQIDVNYYGFTEEAENAFEYAVTIWEGWIDSDVTIEVDAYWEDLSIYGSGVLGAASPYSFKRNFDGATEDNTYYAISLANHLAGKDLNGDRAEIETWFNSEFSNWYFGTDGNTPKGKYDFTTVVLHELGHGFGLTDFIDYNSGKGSYGNTIFESFIVNSDNQSLSSFPNNSTDLGKQLTSNDLFFNGANAIEANNGEKVKLYAPGKWEYGSSVAHLDEKTYPKGDTGSLMTPYLQGGEVIHNPGALTLGILEDLGWDINKVDESAPTQPEETPSAPKEEPAPIQPAETPSTTIPTLDFNFLKSYANQDGKHTFEISDDGKEFEVEGNSWKQLEIDYNITFDTILAFDFKSDKEGEIQGIGFDTDNKFDAKVDTKYLFQLSGTQKLGISEFEYQTNSDWQSYQIRVGDYFTGGDFKYLTFANDHDQGTKDAHSQFRNLRLYEDNTSNFSLAQSNRNLNSDVLLTVKDSTNNYTLSSYGGETQDKGIFSISNDKTEIEIIGNSWQKLDINNYKITENTILKFDFQSHTEAEIQGIGFDNDDTISGSDENHLFQVAGTQDWGIEIEDYTLGSGWKTYEIKVGEHINGEFNYLTLANDQDISNSTAQSQFRNISLFEM